MRCPPVTRRIVLAGAAMMFVSAHALADERVAFPTASYLVGDLQQRLARESGRKAVAAPAETVEAYLSKPAGAGPFPAVVTLHGCEGLTPYIRNAAAERMNAWGYVSLVIDSFSLRGVENACSTSIPPYRQGDAFGALIYLSSLPFVDRHRIALVGRSQGGTAALEVASFRPVPVYDVPGGLAYRAAIAFYPSRCTGAQDWLAIPALIMIGERDDWASPANCELWLRERHGQGSPVKYVKYRGAYHDFDIPALRDGMRYLDHWLQYDAVAAAGAEKEMRDFLLQQLR
jgi:dienelactone hydrolase